MRNRFKIVSLSALLFSGMFVNSFCVGAISEKTIEISKELSDVSKEMIKTSAKAVENIKENKKKLEEALEEYFAALKVLRSNNYKSCILQYINNAYNEAINNHGQQVTICNQNISNNK